MSTDLPPDSREWQRPTYCPSDEDLLGRAVTLARPHRGRGHVPKWVGVMDTFGVGSTVAWDLCVRFGIDPDEKWTFCGRSARKEK